MLEVPGWRLSVKYMFISKKKLSTVAKFAKLVWLAAVQIFCFLSSFFFMLSKHKRERSEGRKESKSNFSKGMTETNLYVVMFSLKHNHHRPQSKRHKEYFCKLIDAVVLRLHKHSSCRPVRCLLQQTKSHTTPSISQAPIRDEARLLPVLLPTIKWTKQVQMSWLWTTCTKSTTRTHSGFSCYSKSQAKERSSVRSPVWRSLFCLKLCFRVIEKKNAFVPLCGF